MKCSARVNNLKVIFSEIVILSKEDDVFWATIDSESGTVLTFQLTFTDIDGDNEQKIETEVKDNVARITCINFKNPFGTGLKEPINVATISGKKVYILFWCYPLGGSSKKIDFLFLMED